MKFNPTDWEHFILVIVLAMALIALAISIHLVFVLWIQTGHPL